MDDNAIRIIIKKVVYRTVKKCEESYNMINFSQKKLLKRKSNKKTICFLSFFISCFFLVSTELCATKNNILKKLVYAVCPTTDKLTFPIQKFDNHHTFVCFEESKNSFSWYPRAQDELYTPIDRLLTKNCLRLAHAHKLGLRPYNQSRAGLILHEGYLLPDFFRLTTLEEIKERNPAFFCHMISVFFTAVDRVYATLSTGFPELFSSEELRIFYFLACELDCSSVVQWALYPLFSELRNNNVSINYQANRDKLLADCSQLLELIAREESKNKLSQSLCCELGDKAL